MELDQWLMQKHGPFMDIQEIADLLRIKKHSIYQQIYLGKLDIPHIKRGKKYLFPTPEVSRYLQDNIQAKVIGGCGEHL
jgi:excisionase family DNA binding protein